MKSNPVAVLRNISVIRYVIYFVLAPLITSGMMSLFRPFIWFLYYNNDYIELLISNLRRSGASNSILNVIFLIFCGCILTICYGHEKRRYVTVVIRRMMQEVAHIASGNFHVQLAVEDQYELGKLAININNVVIQAQKSIEEERMAEKIKNDLVTNVSHDLRTPLTSIIGYLNLINEDRYRDEVELRYFTQIVHDKATRLHELINDLFEFTRMQNKGIMLARQSINMAEMLDQLVVQFHIQLLQANMKCRQDVEANEPVVSADGAKLVRVFENLLANAIAYGAEGRYIDIQLQDTMESVIVSITNYGEGIPAIDIPHIFDRFYRVEKSRTAHAGGSGLGLAIAKSIVDLHEGTITVHSDTERTIFQVCLPKSSG